MSENLGPLTFGHDPAQPFVGREFGQTQEYSEETAQKIDQEIRRVIEEAYSRAGRILEEHRIELERVSYLLLERETIDKEEFDRLLRGEDPAEVFREKDEKIAKKNAEDEKLRERQRRLREREAQAPPRGLAPGGAAHAVPREE
jgi:cell division protease FtsH